MRLEAVEALPRLMRRFEPPRRGTVRFAPLRKVHKFKVGKLDLKVQKTQAVCRGCCYFETETVSDEMCILLLENSSRTYLKLPGRKLFNHKVYYS